MKIKTENHVLKKGLIKTKARNALADLVKNI